MIGRRHFLSIAGAGLAAPFVLSGRGRAQEVSLKLHHFLPAGSNVHRNFLEPWAAGVQEASGGRIAIQIFPAMQLGGAPPQLYDQARDGVVDMVWTLAGYTAGRFPRLEVFDLPFVAAKRGVVNSQAIQEFADKHAAEEFPDVQPLVVWGQDHGVIHAKKAITTLADMKGAKLRSPTRLCGEALQALGATAVSMPVPQVPEALAQGVIDGCVVPWEVVPAIKVHELTGFHTEIPGSPTLYTTAFLLVMNKTSFGNLPEDLRGILMEKSGQSGARMAGQAFDAKNAEVTALVKERGNTVATLAEDEKARWIEATRPVITRWLEEAKGKGIDGDALLAEARALIAKYDQPV
jgi:TRAP-type C4-dicarboxylate transport system substrate-binding protein